MKVVLPPSVARPQPARTRLLLLAAALALIAIPPASAQTEAQDNRAVVVVTGMRVTEEGLLSRRDLTVAEGAVVEISARTPASGSRRAAVTAWRRGASTFFTADFPIALDTSYDIVMTFQTGEIIRIEDFLIPNSWKTHFEFHSTNGTTSASSIMRVGKDEGSGLTCHAYAVWPWRAYYQFGGRQVGEEEQP
jgi:hypothetical protein